MINKDILLANRRAMTGKHMEFLNHHVVSCLLKDKTMSMKVIAKRLGWKRRKLERVLSNPSKIGIDTMSDVIFACDGGVIKWDSIKNHDVVTPEEETPSNAEVANQ